MSTVSRSRPRVKPTRRARLTVANASGGRILTLTVATGRKVEISDYYLLPIPCEGGAAYELQKLQGERETYHVCLAGEAPSCECKGFLRDGAPFLGGACRPRRSTHPCDGLKAGPTHHPVMGSAPGTTRRPLLG